LHSGIKLFCFLERERGSFQAFKLFVFFWALAQGDLWELEVHQALQAAAGTLTWVGRGLYPGCRLVVVPFVPHLPGEGC
jgi:hypothetical protein